MHTPIADKKVVKDRLEMFLLDKFFNSIYPGRYYKSGHRIAPILNVNDLNDYEE